MLEFKCNKFNNNVPIITNLEIDDYAEAIINDYNPKMLTEIIPLDYFEFLENYLNLNIQFTDIYFKADESAILGSTAFNDGDYLYRFEREKIKKEKLELKRGDIVLDNVLNTENMETKQKFTGLHECGHWCMHQKQYTSINDKNQLSFLSSSFFENEVYCCRKNILDNYTKKRLVTDEDFLEHQANFFAAAIAMPKKTIYENAPYIFKECKLKGDRLYDNGSTNFKIAEDVLTKKYMELFKVSKPTANYRLRFLKVIIENDLLL